MSEDAPRSDELELSRMDEATRAAEEARLDSDLPTAARHLAAACIPTPPRTPLARTLLASTIADLLIDAGDAEGAGLARTVAEAPADPDAAFDLGYRLMHHGLAHVAEAFLAVAAAARPDAVPVWLEYLAALDRIGRHDRALAVTDANPGLLAASPAVRYLRAFHALMTGRLISVRDAIPTLDDPVDDVVIAGRARLESVLARAEAVAGRTELGAEDLRGWHMVLNGGLLLSLSADEPEVMHGRYAMVAPTFGVIGTTLATAVAVLRRLDRLPARVLAAPDRSSHIVAHALAALADLEVGALSDDGPGLLVVWDPDTLDPAQVPALQRLRPQRPLLTCGVRWTEAPPFAPDLVGWLHQILLAPWDGGLRQDPSTGEIATGPRDDRDPEAIGAEIAAAATEPDDATLTRLVALTRACADLPDDARPGLLRSSGLRPILWEGAPVTSARFL